MILRSGVFDREWYEAQAGRTFSSTRSAVRDYLRTPRTAGRSPHPLFEPEWADPDGWVRRGEDPFVWFLTSPTAAGRESHVLLPGPAGSPGAWLERVRALGPDSAVGPVDGPRAPWGEVRGVLLDAAREYAAQAELAGTPRVQDRLPHHVGRARPAPAGGATGPLVSIVMPTWNRGPQIRRAIDSVRAQTYGNWELHVVDDGSTDDTEQVLRGVLAFDDRVHVHVTDHGGVCHARNVGIARAQGRYVAFLDSDNTWNPDYLAAMVSELEANDWRMGHAALRIHDDGGVSYRWFEGTLEHLLVANHVDLNVLVVRRDLLEEVGGFDESLRRAVDYDLVLRLAAADHLHQVDVVGADYAEDGSDETRISVSEPHSWNAVVRGRHLEAFLGTTTERVEGRVSVVVPVRRNLGSTVHWMTSAVDGAWGHHDVELVVVGPGISRAHLCIARSLAATLGRVTVLRTPTNVGLAVATNIGLGRATGDRVVLAWPSVTPHEGWLAPLVEALADPSVGIVQSLLLRPDGSVSSAGAAFAPGSPFPTPLLEGFARSDAERLGTGPVPAAYGGAIALRTTDARALGGLDPLLVNTFTETDLSMRAADAGLGSCVLAVRSVATARSLRRYGFDQDAAGSAAVLRDRWAGGPAGTESAWARAGFTVASYATVLGPPAGGLPGQPIGRRPMVHRAAVRVDEPAPTLRWTIDIAAPAGPRGEAWGDTHFARSLAAALQRRGQHVAVDFREARVRNTRDHDDVLLVLRGLDRVEPRRGQVNLQWIISHPELVTAKEAAGFDAVFAASGEWARRKSAQWGTPIEPLLQCTDPALFRPDLAEPDSGPPVLFVGNSRKVNRPSVQAAVAAGADVHVYGGGWDGILDPAYVRGTGIANARVGAHYAAASIVLNDHWDDMRRDGFLSNRLFDAVACGTRVVSDDVPGLAEVFGSSVAVFRSPAEMARLLQEPFRTTFLDHDQRVEAAQAVRTDHSFDHRAEVLLERAIALARTLPAEYRAASGSLRRR